MRGLLLALLLLSPVAAAQRPGEAAPAFELLDLSGESVTLGSFAGEPLLLNFWATWCPPCRAELPLFQRAAAEAPELRVFLINAGEGREQAARFLEEHGLSLPSAVNPDGERPEGLEDTLQMARRYRVRGMPTTYFIGADGVLRSVFVGEISAAVLAERLAEIGVSWQP